ncbi:hypothetical protein PG997_007603 [Apiospora hydei]|uniref:Uncharacterized protein n=1 Tax=Apiospora hydei TaxID=1337664 RepID=A0ABR1W8H1_9PEZI
MQTTPPKEARHSEPAKVKEEEPDHVFVGSVPVVKQGQSGTFRGMSATTPEPSPPSATLQEGGNRAASTQKGLLPLTPKSIESRPRSNPLTEASPTTACSPKEIPPDEDVQQDLQGAVRPSIETDDALYDVYERKTYFPGEHVVKDEDRESTVIYCGMPLGEHTGVNKRKYGHDHDLLDGETQIRSQKQPRHSFCLQGKGTRESSREVSVAGAQEDNKDDTDDKAESDPEVSDSDYDALDHWRREQIVLNAVLKGRDEFSLLPSTWRVHFLGAPVSDCMFYHQTKGMAARPRIYAHEDRYEVRGARHLRNFIEVASRIRDLRTKQAKVARDKRWTDAEKHAKRKTINQDMSKRLHKLLTDAIQWSWTDGDLSAYRDDLLPNIKIMEVSGSSETSPVEVEEQLTKLAERWRQRFDERGLEFLPSHPKVPVIYGFVIMSSWLIIVSRDAANPEANTHTPLKMNMAEACQEGWNALGIMVTVCWARDMLMRLRDDLGLTVRTNEAESDPDA